MTNAVKHFKFELRGKRRIHKTPAQREARPACTGWRARSRWSQPRALVALGATAARALLGRAVARDGASAASWLAAQRRPPVLITLHPSALLRMEAEDKAAACSGGWPTCAKGRRAIG